MTNHPISTELKHAYSFDTLSPPTTIRRKRNLTALILRTALHTLLWSSGYVAGSTAYFFLTNAIDAKVLVPEILLLAAVCPAVHSLPFPSQS